MPFFDAEGSPIWKHVMKIREHKFHFLSTNVYQSSKYGGGAYSANHLVYEMDYKGFGLFVNISPSFGNGINKKIEERGFSSLPTADDLERDVKDINEKGREYLLEAFVKLSHRNAELIAGLVDATAFFDTNNFANDEVAQFMNTDLVNNPLSLLPSYNLGMILNFNYGIFRFSAAAIEGEPDTETVYLLEGGISEEDYNLSLHYFHDSSDEIKGVGISGDYSLGNLGFFFRYGTNSSDEYEYFISGGIVYNLGKHTVGVGVAHRKGDEYEDVNVGEVYYKYNLLDNLHLTLDYQYIDEIEDTYAIGMRLHFEY